MAHFVALEVSFWCVGYQFCLHFNDDIIKFSAKQMILLFFGAVNFQVLASWICGPTLSNRSLFSGDFNDKMHFGERTFLHSFWCPVFHHKSVLRTKTLEHLEKSAKFLCCPERHNYREKKCAKVLPLKSTAKPAKWKTLELPSFVPGYNCTLIKHAWVGSAVLRFLTRRGKPNLRPPQRFRETLAIV